MSINRRSKIREANGTVLADGAPMWSTRHSLALSAFTLFACVQDSPGETVSPVNDESVLSRARDQDVDSTAGNPVDWTTPFVALHADDFRIVVAGKTFLGNASGFKPRSDPGRPNAYTTLEQSWTENGVEMRLFIYFYADGTDWWAGEIRVYDGKPNGEWLAATGEWLKRPLGQSFTGDLDIDIAGRARLTLQGLELQAFLPLAACDGHNAGYSFEVLYPIIEMTTEPNSGFGVNVRLRDGQCQPVDALPDFDIVWTVDDPTLVRLSASSTEPTNALLRGLHPGETTLRVTAKRRTGGSVVAQATMALTVTAAP